MKAYALKSGRGIVFDSIAKTKQECRSNLCIYDAERVDAGIYKIVRVKIEIEKETK